MTADEKREIVRTLAERVMGWKLRVVRDKVFADIMPDDKDGNHTSVLLCGHSFVYRSWSPLDDIADAWMVVEALRKRFRRVEVHALPDGYCCMIADGTSDVDESYPYTAEAETAPEAISLAAMSLISDEAVPK